MEYRDPINYLQPYRLYQSPPPPHQNYQPPPLLSHPSSSSFSFLPNPNPNSIQSFENPFPYPSATAASATAATTDGLRTPGVEPYPNPNPNPYFPHPPFDGPHSIAAQSYQQEVSDYYYQLHQMQQYAAKVGSGHAIADLEIKKLRVLQCGAPADSVRICSICNVVCNSDKVFASHLAGEKHKLKALGLPFNGLKPKVPPHTKALHFTKKAKQPKVPPHTKALHFTKKAKQLKVPPHTKALYFTKKAKQAGPKTTAKKATLKALIAFVESSVCDVCKIDCNSQEVLNNHKLGKKHIRNLQKLQESIKPKPKPKPKPANALGKNSTPNANPSGSGSKADNKQTKQNAAPATKGDLETKKQNVLNGGAAADAVRVCTQCNVVCNSQEVYNSHIGGKKHLSMINKQQQAAAVS